MVLGVNVLFLNWGDCMFDMFEPAPGFTEKDSCIGCKHFCQDDIGLISDCDLCSRNYDQPCGGLPICEE